MPNQYNLQIIISYSFCGEVTGVWHSFRASKDNRAMATSTECEDYTNKWIKEKISSGFCMLLETLVEAGPQLLLQLYVMEVNGWEDKWTIGMCTCARQCHYAHLMIYNENCLLLNLCKNQPDCCQHKLFQSGVDLFQRLYGYVRLPRHC